MRAATGSGLRRSLAGTGSPRRARIRLRLTLGLFFLALAVPSAVLVYTAYDQLKWESFRRQQLAAEGLAERIDRGLADLVGREDARPVSDYGFAVASALEPGRPYAPRSPLADLSASRQVPGLLGWFQVGEDGDFRTPLVPDPGVSPVAYGVTPEELALRQAAGEGVRAVLLGNRLAEGERHAEAYARETPEPVPRRERAAVPALADAQSPEAPAAPAPPVPAAGAARSAPLRDEIEAEASTRLSQAAFDRLAQTPQSPPAESSKARSLGRVEELALDSKLAKGLSERRQKADSREAGAPAAGAPPAQSQARPLPRSAPEAKDKAERRASDLASVQPELAPEPGPRDQPAAPRSPAERTGASADGAGRREAVRLFGRDREPLRLGRLDSGHFILFRNARIGPERVIQGLLIDQAPFLAELLGRPYAESALADNTDLTAAYRGELLTSFRAQARASARERGSVSGYPVSARELTGELLYRTRLGEPFGPLELIFSVGRLPAPPGAAAIGALAGALALVLIGGTWLAERLGTRQIALAHQQQTFVSAVSHELKTPLTSIRMYAEMLRAGFATEARRETYYRYIHEESERLTRLIANVLALSRIGRGALSVEPRPVQVGELMELVRERIGGPAERAGFRIELGCAGSGLVLADPDAFVQVLINLVDNGLKFAGESEPKVLEIGCERIVGARGAVWWRFWVRDYGPGIPREQRRQVFRLFYRGEEATRRAIAGTGIGLALVQELVRAMGGRVEAIGREPGAELSVELPAAEGGAPGPDSESGGDSRREERAVR